MGFVVCFLGVPLQPSTAGVGYVLLEYVQYLYFVTACLAFSVTVLLPVLCVVSPGAHCRRVSPFVNCRGVRSRAFLGVCQVYFA